MANGWARDGAVHDQIDDTVKDAVYRARVMMPAGEALMSATIVVRIFRQPVVRRSRVRGPAWLAGRSATPASGA